MIFGLMKSLRAMDAYIIVREFFDDVDTMVTSTISPTKIEAYVIKRNRYIRLASFTIFAGLLLTQILHYRMKQTHKLNVKNIMHYFKKGSFST